MNDNPARKPRRKPRRRPARHGGTCGPPPADTPVWVSPFTVGADGLVAAVMLEFPPGSGLMVHHQAESRPGSGLFVMEGVL